MRTKQQPQDLLFQIVINQKNLLQQKKMKNLKWLERL